MPDVNKQPQHDVNKELQTIRDRVSRVFEKTGGGLQRSSDGYQPLADIEEIRDAATAILSKVGSGSLFGKPFAGAGPSLADAKAEIERAKADRAAKGEAPSVAEPARGAVGAKTPAVGQPPFTSGEAPFSPAKAPFSPAKAPKK